MVSDDRNASERRRPLTDSPWFWLGLFASMALLALVVVAPKYDRRQGRLVVQQEVREQVHATQPLASRATNEEAPAPGPPAPAERGILNLWPIAGVLVIVVTVAAALTMAARRRDQGA